MSATTSTDLLARKPEDAKQLIDYAIELTKAWSLKKLGYDITVRDEERDLYSGFGMNDGGDGVYWHDYCIFVHDEAESRFEKKAIAKDGTAIFQEITHDEIDFLATSSDFWYGINDPKAEYIKLLFKTDPGYNAKTSCKNP